MRVATYYTNRDVRITQMPKPQIGPDELLVKIMASGICGSDVMEWYRAKKAPLVLGHEITGEITETGKNVKRFKKGQRVFVSHHVPCDKCRLCLNGRHTACGTLHTTNYFPGGFSEYIRVPKINVEKGVFPLPKEISYEDGTFIEPLACVIRGQRLARIKKDRTILILGSGISGLLHLLVAKHNNTGKVFLTDVNEFRLNQAKQLGADMVLNAGEKLPKADFVIICTGAYSAFLQALESVESGGTILFFAPVVPPKDIPLPVNEFWRKEITLLTSYANAPSDAELAIKLIQSRKIPVNRLITHRLSLEDAAEGFKLVSEAKDSVKVIIEPHKNV